MRDNADGGEIAKTALVTTANSKEKISINTKYPVTITHQSTLQIKSKILFFTRSQILDIPIFWRFTIVAAIFFWYLAKSSVSLLILVNSSS